MNCERVKELLFEYIEKELDERDAKMVSEHLMSCEECRKEYEMMLGMSEAIKESRYEAPDELHSRVMTAVRSDKTRKKREKIIRRLGYVAASAAAFVIAVNVILHQPWFNKSSNSPTVENNGVSDRVPAETPTKDNININADTVFYPVKQDGANGIEDTVLSYDTLQMFAGEWSCNLDGGWTVTMRINEDASVVVYIEDGFGLGNYYDGVLIFKDGSICLDQSDGNSVCSAVVEMAIKNGNLLIDVVKGNTPWIEVT